jgi:tetratricopeptide (TPR) repeat protein
LLWILMALPLMAQSPNPEANAARQKGLVLFERKDYRGALPEFELATAKDPQFAEAWFSLGKCYGKLGRLKKKIEAFEKAVAIEPRFVEARYALGFSYLTLGNRPEALIQIKALRRLDSKRAARLEFIYYAVMNSNATTGK